jgi:hypothetical protein
MMRSGDAMEGGERGVTWIHYRNNRFGAVVSLIYTSYKRYIMYLSTLYNLELNCG